MVMESIHWIALVILLVILLALTVVLWAACAMSGRNAEEERTEQ
jgi:sensor domain CHASE-containing protein